MCVCMCACMCAAQVICLLARMDPSQLQLLPVVPEAAGGETLPNVSLVVKDGVQVGSAGGLVGALGTRGGALNAGEWADRHACMGWCSSPAFLWLRVGVQAGQQGPEGPACVGAAAHGCAQFDACVLGAEWSQRKSRRI